ncbi:MAG: hypothetical protein GXX93_09310 [Anaerolineae bacterium]|nr:hypothetical protein [Anaerolineae bacterium]
MSFFRFLFGLALGVGAGYLAGRLLAPASAGDLQDQLRARYHSIRDEAEQAADETRRELEGRYDTAKRTGSFSF